MVQCPVCRTSWHHSSPSPSKRGSQSFLQVSVPVGAEGGRGAMGGGGGGLRLKSLSPSQEMHLSEEKVIILEKIRKVLHKHNDKLASFQPLEVVPGHVYNIHVCDCC